MPNARISDAPARGKGPRHGRHPLVRRVFLGILSTLVSVNLWTGGPLFALWVGSKIQAVAGELSMGAVAATLVVLIVESFVLYRLLALISVRYDAAVGRKTKRQQAAWLKPMSGQRRSLEVSEPLTAVERVVVVSVVVAVLALEVWFFFFAHYTLPNH